MMFLRGWQEQSLRQDEELSQGERKKKGKYDLTPVTSWVDCLQIPQKDWVKHKDTVPE